MSWRRLPPSLLSEAGQLARVKAGVDRMAPGSAHGRALAASPPRLPVSATVLPAAATGGGGGAPTFALDYVEFDSFSGVSLASSSTADIPWSDSDIVDSSASGARPSWLAYQFGTNLLLSPGMYHVAVNGYIAANIGTERISMSVKHNTTVSTPSQPYETGITAGKGSHAQGSVGLMIAVLDPAGHSFYARFSSDTLGATRTCYASVSIVRLGDVA